MKKFLFGVFSFLFLSTFSIVFAESYYPADIFYESDFYSNINDRVAVSFYDGAYISWATATPCGLGIFSAPGVKISDLQFGTIDDKSWGTTNSGLITSVYFNGYNTHCDLNFGFDLYKHSFGYRLFHGSDYYGIWQDFVAGSGYDTSNVSVASVKSTMWENNIYSNLQSVRTFPALGKTFLTGGGLDFVNKPQSSTWSMFFQNSAVEYAYGSEYGYLYFNGANTNSRSYFFGHGKAFSTVLTSVQRGNRDVAFQDMTWKSYGDINSSSPGNVIYGPTTKDDNVLIIEGNGYNARRASYDTRTLVLVEGDGAEMNYVKATLYGCPMTSITSYSGDFEDQCPVLSNGYLSATSSSSGAQFFPFVYSSVPVDLSDSKYNFFFSEGQFVDVSFPASNQIAWSVLGNENGVAPFPQQSSYYIVQLSADQLTGKLNNSSTALEDLSSLVDVSVWTGGRIGSDGALHGSSGQLNNSIYTGDVTTATGFASVMWSCYTGSSYTSLSLNITDYISLLKGTFLDFNMLAPLTCNLGGFFAGLENNFGLSSTLTGTSYISGNLVFSGTNITAFSSSPGTRETFGHLLSLLLIVPLIFISFKLFK